MSNLEFNEWRLRRVKGIIEEYVRGTKKKALDINWVMGALKGSFGVSKAEALELLEQVASDKTLLKTPDRLKRIEILRKRIEQEEW